MFHPFLIKRMKNARLRPFQAKGDTYPRPCR
nr:MAG TPA: hypothetical protein [Caudoviricetes sp.]